MNKTGSKAGDVIVGVAAVFSGHLVMGGIGLALDAITGQGDTFTAITLLFVGVSQLLYVLPLAIWSKRAGYASMAWGAIGAATITGLCNGACWGAVSTMSF